MVLERGLLTLAMDMDLPLLIMLMEESAMKPEAPRDLEDTMATMELERGLLSPLTTMLELPPLSMSTVLSTPMVMESATSARDLLDMAMDMEAATSMCPGPTLPMVSMFIMVRVSRMICYLI